MSGPSLSARLRFLALAFGLLLLSGCASQVSTAEIRRDLAGGDLDSLRGALEDSYKDRPVMMNALNLGRFHQFRGEWAESSRYFDEAGSLLEDYEQRAIVSLRDVGGGLGVYTLSRGSAPNFGFGYERSLLHTFNSFNYLMQGDFQGAAVEMRRMELRQELWLEESGHRLRARLEEEKKNRSEGLNGPDYSDENLPAGYSMGEILRNPELRRVASAYQDPFSYSLSALVCRICGDEEYARVSLSRACQLDEGAYRMFRAVWRRPPPSGSRVTDDSRPWEPVPPPLPRRYREGAPDNPPRQEVVLVYLGGLAPALKMEQIRVPFPQVGYILLDLPAYEPEIPARPPLISASGGELAAHPLLRTELLAYRNLQDEIGRELASSISRAMFRVAVAAGGQALAASNEDTEAASPLVGLLLTLGMDLFSGRGNDNVRNWELLPARGWLGLAELPRGASITLTFSGNDYTVQIPKEARGVVILASQVDNAKLKVDYVAY